jgi:hypothetical protein
MIEPAGHFTGNVIPEEESDNFLQSSQWHWRRVTENMYLKMYEGQESMSPI